MLDVSKQLPLGFLSGPKEKDTKASVPWDKAVVFLQRGIDCVLFITTLMVISKCLCVLKIDTLP